MQPVKPFFRPACTLTPRRTRSGVPGGPQNRRSSKPKRQFLSIEVTAAQKEAIVRAAARLGLNVSNFGRMVLLKATDYDPDKDPDLKLGSDE